MTRLTKSQVALIIAGLLYVISPLDFIPELIAGPLVIGSWIALAGGIAALTLSLTVFERRQPAFVVHRSEG